MTAFARKLKSLFSGTPKAARVVRKTRLAVEGLETRDLLTAVVTATLSGGVLRVEGTDAADVISLKQSASGQVSIDGLTITAPSGVVAQVPAGQINRIEILGRGGDDSLRLDYSPAAITAPVLIDAGPGNDYVQGGVGHDVLVGGPGDDYLRGRAGNDILLGDEGSDSLTGDSGDDHMYENTLTGPRGMHVGGAGSGVRSAVVEPSGSVLILDAIGELRRITAGVESVLASQVIKVASAPTGAAYLKSDGRLVVENLGSWANTRDFAIADNGTLYWLGTSGVFQRRPVGGTWQDVSSTVSDFQVSGGHVVWLEGGAAGRLYEQPLGGSYRQIAADVRDFAIDANGTLYILNVSGLLQYRLAGSSTWSGNWANTWDFDLDGLDRLLVLNVSGLLQRLDGTVWTDLDFFVESIEVDAGELQIRYTKIGERWHALGGDSGPLGAPIGTVNQGDGFTWQNFQKGVIYYSAATGAHAITGSPSDPNTFWGRFAASGFQNGLGLPTSEMETGSGMTWQTFQQGTIVLDTRGATVAPASEPFAEVLDALRTNQQYLDGYREVLATGGWLDLKATKLGAVLEEAFRLASEVFPGDFALEVLAVRVRNWGGGVGWLAGKAGLDLDDLEFRLVTSHSFEHDFGLGLQGRITNRVDMTGKLGQMCQAIVTAYATSNPAALLALLKVSRVKATTQLNSLPEIMVLDTVWFEFIADAYAAYNLATRVAAWASYFG